MIGNAIYYLLSNDATLSGLIGTRIYPDLATQQAVYPFCVYMIDEVQPSDTKDGASVLDQIIFNVTTYAKSYTTAQEIASACRAVLDAHPTGTVSGVDVQAIRFTGQRSDRLEVDKGVYIVSQDYRARIAV